MNARYSDGMRAGSRRAERVHPNVILTVLSLAGAVYAVLSSAFSFRSLPSSARSSSLSAPSPPRRRASAFSRVARGIAPPGSHGTEREPLGSRQDVCLT